MDSEVTTVLSTSRDCLTICVDITATPLSVRRTQLGTRVRLDGWPIDTASGVPLPAKTLWIALPSGTTARGAEARVLASSPITDGPATLAPLPSPRPDSPFALGVAARPGPRRKPLGRRSSLARLVGTRTVGGTPVALVAVSPVVVEPDGSLTLASRLEIAMPLETARVVRTAKRLRLSDAQLQRGLDLAATAVVNPVDLPRPTPHLRDLAHGGYLIITDDFFWNPTTKTPIAPIPQGLTGAFARLRDWRTSLGFSARLVTVSEIVASTATSGLGADFVTGAADLQEVIRRFVRWAHANWGTAYVLIGGDQSVVPIRQLKIGIWTEFMPTDMYYAALDPAFDFAENASPNLPQIGNAAYEPDVSLGRAPVTTRLEADTFVGKVISYERAPLATAGSDWLRRMLFASSKLGGDIAAVFPPSLTLPPGTDHYYHAPGAAYSLLQLIELVTVTQDANASTTSPDNNRFNRPPGKTYYKIHLDGSTYRLPQNIVAVSPAGNVSLVHDVDAAQHGSGWFYTDWLDYDGPCHDAAGANYPSSWIIAYVPAGVTPQRFEVHLDPALRTGYNLLAKMGMGDYRAIPYDATASAARPGWYFATAWNNVAPTPRDATGTQVPSSWIAIFTSASQLTPAEFQLDPKEEADTAVELEHVRKDVASKLPGWNAVSRLYPDVVDLPPADAGGDVAYYTQDRLRTKLNAGQHFVYLASHGLPESTLAYGEGGELDDQLADALVNAPRWGICYVSSCLTGRYTQSNSLARHLVVKNAAGGLVGFVAFMDELQFGLGVPFGEKLLTGIAATSRLGPAVDARVTLLEPGSGIERDQTGCRAVVGMSLLGDPAMTIHGTFSDTVPSVGWPYFFASEAIALARLGGYAVAGRNQLDATAQWNWTVGKTPEAVLAELKDRYTLQFQRQLGLGSAAAADFYADSAARLGTYGLVASVSQDPAVRDPNRDVHRAWAVAMLLLPGGAGASVVRAQLLARLDDAYYALFDRPRRFLEMLFASESVGIERLAGTVSADRVDGLAARATWTRLRALRDELVARAAETIEGSTASVRADYYAAACLRLNSFGVDFRTTSANSLDTGLHRGWALVAAVPNVVEQLVGRIRKIFDQLGVGDPPAAEVRVLETQGGQIVEVAGSQLDFGTPVPGQPVTRKLRVYDVGDGEFLVTSPALSGGFTSANTTVTLRNQLVDAMTCCEVEITFTPTGAANVTGTLRLATTAAATPALTIALRAAPLAPLVRFDPMGRDFGPQKIGTPQTLPLALTNSGTCAATDVVLDLSRMQGPAGAQFRLLGAPAPRSSLAAGASAAFQVEFTPTEPIIIQTALTVTYESAADPAAESKSCAIILGGWGIAPAISAPASVDFGWVKPGTAAVQRLLVRNGGQAGLVISRVWVQGGLPSAFSVVLADGSTGPELIGPLPSVFPGTVTEICVSFAFPKPNAHLSDALCIASDDPAQPQLVIALSAATTGAAGVAKPEFVNFGLDPQPPNDLRAVTISSKGSDPLELRSVSIAGVLVATDGSQPAQSQDKLDFVAEALPAKLPAIAGGTTLSFKVRFRPLGSGAKRATLVVDTNVGKLNAVVLAGTKS